MKILFVIPYLASIYGGPAKVVRDLSKSLASNSTSVDVITSDANGAGKLEVPLNYWLESDGYRIRYFSCWHRNDLILSHSLVQWLLVNASNYDLIHLNNIFAPLILVAEWVCQLRKIPYVVTSHGMLEPWALSYKARKKRYYYKLLERPALQRAAAIHVLTVKEAQNVQALGFLQTATVPNGIHWHEFQTLPSPDIFWQVFPETKDKTVILFLGRIDPKKGLDLLATAFENIHRQFPDTHLVVAGPDSIGFLTTVRQYFEQANCSNAVTFTGMLTGELKHAALAAADLYVAPSYSEGFSMSVLEAMAASLPCVITKECNFSEAEEVGVAKVVEVEADAIEQALRWYLSYPESAKQMGERARQFIFECYTWEEAARKLSRIYESIVTQTPLTRAKISEVKY